MPLSASKIHVLCCCRDMFWKAPPAPAELGELVLPPDSALFPFLLLHLPRCHSLTHIHQNNPAIQTPAQTCDLFDRPGWGRQPHMHWCQQIGGGWASRGRHFLTPTNSTHNIPKTQLCLRLEAKPKQCSIKQGKNLGQELWGSLAAATKPWDTKEVLPLRAKNSGLKWKERLHGKATSHWSMFYLMEATARI